MQQSNIMIKKVNGDWVSAYDYQKYAFEQFKLIDLPDREYKYNNNGIIFTIKRYNFFSGTFLIREDGSRTPIVDMNNVKVFLVDHPSEVKWYLARDYQIWAFYDFIYNNNPIGQLENIRKYKSYNSDNIFELRDYITIPLTLEPNIIFTISRDTNGSIYYETNNETRRRIKISDSEKYRQNYQGFYNRITDSNIIIDNAPFHLQQSQVYPVCPVCPDIQVIPTQDEEIMCIVCNINTQNIKFLPCNHSHTCSSCYNLLQGRKICPICRSNICSILII